MKWKAPIVIYDTNMSVAAEKKVSIIQLFLSFREWPWTRTPANKADLT